MRDWNIMVELQLLYLAVLLFHGAVAAHRGQPVANVQEPAVKWQTLSGNAPLVIARGGFSGLFPDSSQLAYQFALSTSVKDAVMFCDLQLSQDGVGFCHTGLGLENSTNIAQVFPQGQKTYSVNGESISGWFSVDYASKDLFEKVALIQSIFSRPSVFDNSQPMSMVGDFPQLEARRLWFNVQYNSFFKEHKLDMTEFVLAASEELPIEFISSPEIDFLKGLNVKVTRKNTKFIFRILEGNNVEPSTNQTYDAILKDLKTIKSFASGILVPKQYIWPVNKDQYLEPATNLVADAHQLGLEVYAYNFANDAPASYNYSYDPAAEYLQFVYNSAFAVDGVLTDFPSTASGSIACLAYNEDNAPQTIKGKPLIISHNGASGIYAGSTDLAYRRAIDDGADVIDCSVQMTKDGVAFCLNSADLMGDTTVMKSFMSRASTVPEIQQNKGIFSFDLTWSEIQTLKPLSSPLPQSGLNRNPAMKNDGKFFALAEFLDFTKDKSVPGILISIELQLLKYSTLLVNEHNSEFLTSSPLLNNIQVQNAAFLASKKGLDIVDAVCNNLTNAGYDKQTTKQVYIQSDDTSVLEKFKKVSSYKRVLMLKDPISDAPKAAIAEIKQFADAVNLPRSSLVSFSDYFLSGFTPVMKEMSDANVSVYVSVLRNEFMTLAFDYFSDPVVEIATFVLGIGVDGLVTEYPATANNYLKSPCFYSEAQLPYTIMAAEPGGLLGMASPEVLPPAQPPAPVLEAADVVDPPLPPVSKVNADDSQAANAPSPPNQAGVQSNAMNAAFCLLMVVFSSMSLSSQLF